MNRQAYQQPSDLYRSQLRAILAESFSLDELKTLCFDLNVEFDDLGGEGKTAKVRELLLFMERRAQLEGLLQEITKARPHLTFPGSSHDIPPCPYRGLELFREQDAPLFFGRTVFVQQLRATLQHKNLVTILGASGCGKSSVVLAGLLPVLFQENSWLVAKMRPGKQPFQTLAAALLPLWQPERIGTEQLSEISNTAAALQDRRIHLEDVIQAIVARVTTSPHLLLVIDQFEELYALCPEDERRRFLDGLFAAAGKAHSPFKVVFILRADFLGQALTYRPLADVLNGASLILGPMNRTELLATVIEPASKMGVMYEMGLAERIVDDVLPKPYQDDQNNLPMLQFALTILWEWQTKRIITHTAYEAVGQAKDALIKHAEQVYTELSPGEQRELPGVLVQFIQPGKNTEDTRRQVLRSELKAEGWQLVHKLAAMRLVVMDVNASKQETAEIVHETLIRHWQRLRQWMEAERQFREWQERLRDAKRQWQAYQNRADFPLRGSFLVESRNWLNRRPTDVTTEDTLFIKEGIYLKRQEQIGPIISLLGVFLLIGLILRLTQTDIVQPQVSPWQPAPSLTHHLDDSLSFAVAIAVPEKQGDVLFAADRTQGGFYRYADGEWQNYAEGTFAGQVVRQLHVTPDNTLYVLTATKLYRQQLNQGEWQTITLPEGLDPLTQPVWSLTIWPERQDNHTLFVGVWHSGVWRQKNGQEWEQIIAFDGLDKAEVWQENHIIRALAVDANNLFVATDQGLYETDDMGQNVRQLDTTVFGEAAIMALLIETESNRLLVGTRGQGLWAGQVQATEVNWRSLTYPDIPFIFSLSVARDQIYIGSSTQGVLYQQMWHWWQRGWWQQFLGATVPLTAVPPINPDPIVVEQKRLIRAGEFEEGIATYARLLYLEDYWLDQTEVSWQAYCEVVVDCTRPTEYSPDLPVVNVSWDAAAHYCQATGGFLPTEAQWEKAMRAPDGRSYPWGDHLPELNRANQGINLLPVIENPNGANPYALNNLIGNVWEFVADPWQSETERFYSSYNEASTVIQETPTNYTIRGGGIGGMILQVGTRINEFSSSANVGFRCAYESP